MEKKTSQRKPYQRAWCKLTDYSQETVMFALSGTDVDGISLTTVAAWESAKRMKANGEANGGPDYRPYTWSRYNPAYYTDPLLNLTVWDYYYEKTRLPGCESAYASIPIGQYQLDYPHGSWGDHGAWGRGGGIDVSSLRAFADGLGCDGRSGYGYGSGSTGNACGYCC